MKYLCTGGAGFIGSNLVKRLLFDGHDVVVLDDFSRGRAHRLLGYDCEIFPGDITQLEDVMQAAQGCDSIIHMAYLQGTQTFYANPRTVLDTAVYGITNVLKACEIQGIGDLMLISSSEAYQVAAKVPTDETVALSVPDPLNPRYSYGGGKLISELMAIAYAREGVLDRLIIVRPHNIFGPDMGFEHVIPEFCVRLNKLIKDDKPDPIVFPIQGSGFETRSFCFIDDCVDALAILLEKAEPLGIYHLGAYDERSIKDVADQIAKAYGRMIAIAPGTLPKGSPPRRCPDISKLEALGYNPKTPFTAGIKETVAWYQQDQ